MTAAAIKNLAMSTSDDMGSVDRVKYAATLSACLEYLCEETGKYGLDELAHLIGVAATAAALEADLINKGRS